MRRNNKPFIIIILLILFVIFILVPLGISIAYGNIPLFNSDYLENYDVLVSNDPNLSENELSFINNNTYTWSEIKSYILRNEMTFSKAFRNTVFVVGIAILSVILDRLLFRRK
ncbi:hypothetical protein Pryu01_00310 [Paraliobacillus ryukyuensis]|uniref:Uncharacterized protein n=1 Tax=Paraliobacillus ryukyuensis TaxID=200904 RepID=A0A366EH00_9BACI|nr:hypothetical protein [Paraliobacillus ryukyuensis]RBP01618.1 hypothetical protein DES48_101357 [Paraliobacillus ryukyuensis]